MPALTGFGKIAFTRHKVIVALMMREIRPAQPTANK
jgi:hypothetical protein